MTGSRFPSPRLPSPLIAALLVLPTAPALARTGGPDAFGYSFADSAEPDGPAFAWEDLSASGSVLALADDDDAVLDLGFTFWFYGQPYTTVTTGDGLLVLGTDAVSNRNACVPADNQDGSDVMIMALWDDLDPGDAEAGPVTWAVLGDAPGRRFILQYDGIPHYGGDTRFAFQVVLAEGSNDVEIHYRTVEGTDDYAAGLSATVGIQGATPLQALQYACKGSDALEDGLAIRFRVTCEDADGDGWGPCVGDCDDADPTRSPGVAEALDGLDQDCDGIADDDWVVPGTLVITEFMDEPMATDPSTGEWFEVWNTGDVALNLAGWTVSDDAGEGFEILGDLPVEPGALLVFATSDDPALNGGLPRVDYTYGYDAFPLRSYDPSQITLTAGALQVDRLAYTNVDPWASEPGRSLYLDPAALDPSSHDDAANDDPAAWCPTPDDPRYALPGGDLGTPGEPNPSEDGDADGFTACGGDCDDADPAQNPSATETCADGADDDCDGLVDGDDPDCAGETGTPDTGTPDTGDAETGGTETGSPDTADPDDTGVPADKTCGCATRTVPTPSGFRGGILLLAAGLAGARRRRDRREPATARTPSCRPPRRRRS